MTDNEVDVWLETHAHYDCSESVPGLLTFALGHQDSHAEPVGFVIPAGKRPSNLLVRRFLARWWIERFGT